MGKRGPTVKYVVRLAAFFVQQMRVYRAKRLSNLLSGNFSESGSCLLAFPLDVGLRV